MSVSGASSQDEAWPVRFEAQDAYYMRQCADIHRSIYPSSRAEWFDIAGGAAIYMEPGSPLTKAMGIGMSGPVTSAELDRLEDFFRTRGGIVRVDLCPYADPTLLRELSLRGYRPDNWKQSFVRTVTADDAAFDPPAGIDVRQASGENQLEEWVRVVSRGFHPDPTVPDPYESIYRTLGHVPDNVLFIASIDGTPVGGACLGVEGGLASLVSTSVLPDFRRRGVHSALLRARLRWLARQEVRHVRIAANPGSDSERNILRFGFRPLYSRLVVWRDLGARA